MRFYRLVSLTGVSGGGLTTSYTYNGDGDRLAQTANGVTTNYVLDPVGLAQVLIETTGGQSKYDLPGLAEYTTSWTYYLPDHLGSLRHLVDPTGAVQLSQSYDPFGRWRGNFRVDLDRFKWSAECALLFVQ